MPELSAGILLYRRISEEVEVLLVHPGGPFFARKDAGVWSIPKGLVDPGEALIDAARREFVEETGHDVPDGDTHDLGDVRLKSGKRVHAFAVEGDVNSATIVSNTFELEWPPKSGRTQSFPEVDRAGWFTLDEAAGKLNAAQADFLTRLPPR
ncbi:NUDIX domain-containing protein [Gordonia sp. MP11Mi]|uniref:Nudix hydrolase domain-containing protein n=1 Tax=Gordonia sp. MP11Mi TaxID=3022769 RepID=A0AA97CXX3_9ACTN